LEEEGVAQAVEEQVEDEVEAMADDLAEMKDLPLRS
jgi:hypothetical protein